MNWLITGGCGFIGLNLVKNLIEEGEHYIRIVDNLSVGTREDLSEVCEFIDIDPKSLNPQTTDFIHQNTPYSSAFNPQSFSGSFHRAKPDAGGLCPMPGKVDLIVADILNEKLTIKAALDIDVIVHLAANTGVAPSVENPRSDCFNNVIGTLNCLEAARYNNIKRFIFASSGAPIGECEPPIHEERLPRPISPYGASKLSGEAYCSVYFRTYGIETIALRFGNVYGPLSAQKNSVVAKFVKRVMEGKPLEIFGDGKQTRDFIFIEDLIRAIRLSAITEGIGGEIFQIATNTETSIAELVDELIQILVRSGFKNLKVLYKKPRIGDVKRNFSDTSKARRHLGWHAEIELLKGLQQTVNWFIENRSK